MYRDLEKNLLQWKNSPIRKPLLLRGARQVGKTYLIEHFSQHFNHLVEINFEKQPKFIKYFEEDLDPKRILSALELVSQKSIVPGNTLLFFDEIQECPRAITALRYFKEEMPDLHVIGAGSLLEFANKEPGFRMPVGRIQYLYLRPLSFCEFLDSLGFHELRNSLNEVTLESPPSDVLHQELIALFRQYLLVGGMPEVVNSYAKHKSFLECQNLQTTILDTYKTDFAKYATTSVHKYLSILFEKAPGLVAQWFKYAKVDPSLQSRDLKPALEKLKDAGILHLVHATAAQGLPLISGLNEKKFKLLYLDIGLLKRACGLDLEILNSHNISLINQGALTEQFVGQELIAYSPPDEKGELFFWVKESSSAAAEVDYLMQSGTAIIPIEVKSGATGKLRSLKQFIKLRKSLYGVRICQQSLSREGQILNVPFYLISQLRRICRDVKA